MNISLSLRLAVRCTVCRQLISTEDQRETAFNATLYGSVPYAVCVSCGQTVDETKRNNIRYQRRYDRFLSENPPEKG